MAGQPVWGTTSEDYSRRYYEHYSDTDETYGWESPEWRAFFTGVARRLLATTGPADRVLDVGCAKGLLVQAFLNEGCDAYGIDISQTSIAEATEGVRDRVKVASATDPFDGSYDLITCIEVLEHMSPRDAEQTIDNMCAATDRVVLSSTPGDFDEPTHINVHPVADWAAAFATRGFFRRTDVDLGYLAPWALYLERAKLTPRDVVHRYETSMYPLRLEVKDKREAVLQAHRELSRLEDQTELRELKHQLLTCRDHAIGCEAEAGTARGERDLARAEIARLTASLDDAQRRVVVYAEELKAVRTSERWRVGGLLLSPVAAVKRRGHQ